MTVLAIQTNGAANSVNSTSTVKSNITRFNTTYEQQVCSFLKVQQLLPPLKMR